MKQKLTFIFSIFTFFYSISCNQISAQGIKNLNSDEFEKAILNSTNRILLDVRTPAEHNASHISGSLNMNVNDENFIKQIERLDKTQPVYVYCLSGGRSSTAAAILIENGFKDVYNLSGGISKWKSENKSVISKEGNENKGFSKEDYLALTSSNNDTLVLVDFFAPWCKPCKTINAYLPNLQKDFKGKLKVVKINYDDNPKLVKLLNIETVPHLQIISSKNTKNYPGFQKSEFILAELNASR
jgi:rhodanese-related sulfurtransferase